MVANNSTEKYFISSFINGLKAGLQPMIWLLKPQTLKQAFEQAPFQEQPIIEMA